MGRTTAITLQNSYVEDLSMDMESGDSIGGLVGQIQGVASGLETVIDRCYVANSYLSVSSSISRIGGLVGASIGFASTRIQDSYAWENVLGSPNISGVDIGGLVGAYNSSGMTGFLHTPFFITNSYTSRQIIVASSDGGFAVGGLIGETLGGEYTIRNSFSPTSFGGFDNDGTIAASQSSMGGLIGSLLSNDSNVHLFDSYFTGRIFCIDRSRYDGCGGIIGSMGASGNFQTGGRFYSTAQVTATSHPQGSIPLDRIDGVGLVLGNRGRSEAVGETMNPARVLAALDDVYFVRDRINVRGPSQPIDSSHRQIQSTSQPCADIVGTTQNPRNACPNLRVNDNMGTDTGTVVGDNRGLTKAQMQTVPSSSTNDGNSPAKLGDAFLYTAGWCPRVCRRGVSPCTDETSLVGFDASGQPLPGPGGGLMAQANNEGDKCFDVEPIERDDIPDAPPPPTAGPPLPVVPMVSRACTVTGNFSNNFLGGVAGGGSGSGVHSAPSDPSANNTLSVFAGSRARQTVGTASVSGTAAALNVESNSFPVFNVAMSPITIDAVLEITALDVSMPGTLCMDENASEITLDAAVVISGTSGAVPTAPNGTHTGGNPTGNTLDGCTLRITQAAAMTGEVAEFELQNCIFTRTSDTDNPIAVISVKFRVAIP